MSNLAYTQAEQDIITNILHSNADKLRSFTLQLLEEKIKTLIADCDILQVTTYANLISKIEKAQAVANQKITEVERVSWLLNDLLGKLSDSEMTTLSIIIADSMKRNETLATA